MAEWKLHAPKKSSRRRIVCQPRDVSLPKLEPSPVARERDDTTTARSTPTAMPLTVTVRWGIGVSGCR